MGLTLGGPEREWGKHSHRTRVSMCEVPNCRCVCGWRRGVAALRAAGWRCGRGRLGRWTRDWEMGMPRSYRGLGRLWLFRGLN